MAQVKLAVGGVALTVLLAAPSALADVPPDYSNAGDCSHMADEGDLCHVTPRGPQEHIGVCRWKPGGDLVCSITEADSKRGEALAARRKVQPRATRPRRYESRGGDARAGRRGAP